MEVITDGKCLQHLDFLLEFLAAWEERPTSLARMAYQWCATISKAAGKLGLSGGEGTRRLQLRELTSDERLSKLVEEAFSKVGLMRLDATFRPQDPTPNSYVDLLHTTLEIGFRRVAFSPDGPPLRLDHTPHHEWAFETAFSNNDDEVLADALSVWILGDRPPPGSCARYLAKRVKMVASFSPRLRQVAVHVIERIWRSELELSGPETVSLLNRLNVGMDDTGGKCEWAELLVDAIRSPTGLKVSSHYWHLLDELALATDFRTTFVSADVEIMRSLRKIEDWNRLEIWTVVVWRSQTFGTQMSKAVEGAEQETLNLLLGQPSAIPRFEALRLRGEVRFYDVKLQQICDQAQANTLSPEPPTPQPCVPVSPVQHLSILMPHFLASAKRLTLNHSPPLCGKLQSLKVFIACAVGWCTESWNIRAFWMYGIAVIVIQGRSNFSSYMYLGPLSSAPLSRLGGCTLQPGSFTSRRSTLFMTDPFVCRSQA